MTKQKEIFLQTEGNTWFIRNNKAIATRKLPNDNDLLREVLALPVNSDMLKVLEIGCSDRVRLAWLKKNINADCYGIELSAQALERHVQMESMCSKAQSICCLLTTKVLILLCLYFAFICLIVKTCFVLLARQIQPHISS